MEHKIWVKFKVGTVCNGRNYDRGSTAQVDSESFRQLMREGLAVPCGDGGRMLTTTARVTDFEEVNP